MTTRAKSTEDWSDLVTFEKVGARIGDAVVNITPRGSITFNRSFLHTARKQLEGQTHAILSYSKKNRAIVMEFTDDDSAPGAIKRAGANKNYLSSRSFFQWHFLDINEIKGKYHPELKSIPKKGNCWVIYLQKKS